MAVRLIFSFDSEEIAALKRDFDAFLAWVVQRPEVELTTYRRLYAAYRPKAVPWLERHEVTAMAAHASEFSFQQTQGEWLSPAEQFGVLVRAVALLGQLGTLSEAIGVRRLLGSTETPPSAVIIRRTPWVLNRLIALMFSP